MCLFFYNNYSNMIINTNQSACLSLVNVIKNEIKTHNELYIKQLNSPSQLNQKEYTDSVNQYYEISDSFQNNHINIFIKIYKYDSIDNEYQAIFDSDKNLKNLRIDSSRFLNDINTELKNSTSNDIINIKYDSNLGQKTSFFSKIQDSNGQNYALVEVGINSQILDISLMIVFIDLFLLLITSIIFIILTFSELNNFLKALIKKMENKQKSIKMRGEFIMYRPLQFLLCCLIGFNSVLLVIISKDILINIGLESDTFLIGLPAIFMSFGTFFSQALFDFFKTKLSIKNCALLFCLFQVLFFGICIYSIQANNFILFCIATFFSSLFIIALGGLLGNLPLLSEDQKLRFSLFNDRSMATISGNIVSVFICGLLAQFLGNFTIYCFAIFISIILILLICVYFPKNEFSSKNSKKNINYSAKDLLKVIFKPIFIMFILLVLLPDSISCGFKNFVFPLIGDTLGFNKVLISNLFSISSFLAFLVNKPITNFCKRFNY